MNDDVLTAEAPASGAADSPGAVLRRAREARGLSLSEVAQTLKLTPKQLEAIEAEAFDRLPGKAFARGFVRNYARLLGIDAAPLLERLEPLAALRDVQLEPVSNAVGAVPNEPAGYRSPSPLPAVAIVGVLVLVGLVAWQFNLVERLASQPQGAQSATAQPAASDPLFPPHSAETAVVTAQVEAQPLVTVSAPAPVADAAPGAGQSPADAGTPGAVAASAPASIGTAVGVDFEFDADAWVEVRDSTGRVVFSRLNRAGERQTVLGRAPFALVVGNAPNVRVRYNGRAVDLVPHTKVSVARLKLE